jgi:transposase
VRKRQREKLEKDAGLGRENRRLTREKKRLEQHLEREQQRHERERERLQRKIDELREHNDRLKKELEAARRAGKRQAAPFSKGDPNKQPRRPGRKRGDQGRRGHRKPPPRVDEVLDAALPSICPHCQGPVEETGVEHQWHTELPPVTPHVTQFDVHVGHCTGCGRRVQGRHPQQTSDALGAAASQLGPRAKAFASALHAQYGMSFGKVQALFQDTFDVSITRGGLYLATAKVASVLTPTHQAFQAWIRKAPIVSPDETGWRVAGIRQWLWVFVTPELTVYAIQPGRGFEQAAQVLGEDYAGTLVRDGWPPYRCFVDALHQTCLAHLLRRCHENLETALRGTARVPRLVQAILKDALALRDRFLAEQITLHGLRSLTGKLETRMDQLLGWNPTDDDNRKLLDHLGNERDALFTFLANPELGVPATNYWSEQAIRPAVVNRKVFGGNRTWGGARTLEIQISYFRTCHQQRQPPAELLVDLLRAPEPMILDRLAPSWIQDTTIPPRAPP